MSRPSHKDWIKLEKEYQRFVVKYNRAKEEYFKLEDERGKRVKALDSARSDYMSALRDYFIAPNTKK